MGLPHVLVLKDIHLTDRSLADYEEAWQINRLAFLDRVFDYPFMEPYRHFRPICEERLAAGQKVYFKKLEAVE